MAGAAASTPTFTGESPFTQSHKDRKSKLPILPSNDVWAQYQAKLEAERISDEEFADIWRGLREEAVAAQHVAAQPYDIQRARANTTKDAEGVTSVEEETLDPDFEYTLSDGQTIDGKDALVAIEMARAERAAAEPDPIPEDEMTFDDKVEQCWKVVNRSNRFREILRKSLEFCDERRPLHEAEDNILAMPEYKYAAQNPYRMLRFLIDNYGMDLLELDEEGEIVTAERKVGLTEDEIDDLVVEFALETTDVGREVARRLQPESRIADLLRQFPIRFSSYRDVMNFCREPKSMKEIVELFKDVDLKALGTMHSDKTIAIQPSVFVDKLEKAGAMYWDGKWNLTAEGRAFLNGMDKFKL